jgi:hypothetical protein
MAKLKKLQGDELTAAGMYFGCSNLGLFNWSELQKVVLENQPNWKRISSILESKLGSMAESDEMMDGLMDECKSFIRDLKGTKHAYWTEQWDKIKKGEAK